MIYLDIDGVLVDFYGTAKKFGIELELNKFGSWKWGVDGYPTAENFYKAAEPQPWSYKLLDSMEESRNCITFLTKDFSKQKRLFFHREYEMLNLLILETPNGKAAFCEHPCDLLIDDNPDECDAWRDKGGFAYWLNLAEEDPFGKFLKWWRLE